MNSYLEYQDNLVDRNLLNRLVKVIYNREGNEYVWVMNFTSLEIINPPEKIDKFSEEYRQYLKDDDNFNIPIVIDSPLAVKLLDCYQNNLEGEWLDKFNEMMYYFSIHIVFRKKEK